MKTDLILFHLLKKKTISLLFLGLCTFSNAQISVPVHAWKITKNAEKFHYQPKPLDDEFGLLVCNLTCDNLDPNGLYFTEEDILNLRKESKSISSDIPNQKSVFLTKVTEVYQSRLELVESLLKSFETKTIVLKDETLKIENNHPFVVSSEFNQKWEKVLKARILRDYLNKSDSVEISIAPNSVQIEETKLRILETEKEKITSKKLQKGGISQKVGASYLKAIANAYDPHSEYFSVSEEEEFSNYLSKEVQAFGFTIELTETGEFEIIEISPGSSAWRSNLMNEEDVILKAKFKNKLFTFENKTMEEVAAFLSNEKLEVAHFWIRKKNGEVVELDLSKTAIEVEENLIESFVLEGSEKIGYVYLPSFYSKGDGINSYATGCANDVAKELIHLQKEGISGLVLDLRSNGGGSMLESLLLAGIFIDYGALSVYHAKGSPPETLKDLNKGILFDKPMVVLIDPFSASASELFSAAMQDHHRALIVGSNSYGKSTAQMVYPIDAYATEDLTTKKQDNPEAFIKITGGAFYRVTGQTHQSQGIVPDIHLPNAYELSEYGEKFEQATLNLNPIEKKTYYTPWPDLPIQELQMKSSGRVQSNVQFKEIEKESKILAEEKAETKIPLSFELYKSNWLKDEESTQGVPTQLYKVKNPNYINGTNSVHIGSEAMNQFAIQNILEDLYIEEAYSIINDLIQSQKNNK